MLRWLPKGVSAKLWPVKRGLRGGKRFRDSPLQFSLWQKVMISATDGPTLRPVANGVQLQFTVLSRIKAQPLLLEGQRKGKC